MPLRLIHETTMGLRMAVGVGYIRFDVVNWCAIHQVSTLYIDNRSKANLLVHPVKADAGEAKIIRAKGRASGKHPHTAITTQTGRAYRQALPCIAICRKFPDKPEIVKVLKTSQGILLPVFRLEDDASLQLTDEAALSGDSEL